MAKVMLTPIPNDDYWSDLSTYTNQEALFTGQTIIVFLSTPTPLQSPLLIFYTYNRPTTRQYKISANVIICGHKLDWSVCTYLTQLYDGRDMYIN